MRVKLEKQAERQTYRAKRYTYRNYKHYSLMSESIEKNK